MKRRIKTGIWAAALPLALLGCSQEQPQQPQPIKRPPVQQQALAPSTEAIPQSAGIEASVDAKARNPFQSYIIVMRGTRAAGSEKVRGPLECCELSSFKLVAVVLSKDNSFGLVQAPDGKRYIVRRGDSIGIRDGKVVKIEDRSITVRETGRDEAGSSVSEDTELRLPSERKQQP